MESHVGKLHFFKSGLNENTDQWSKGYRASATKAVDSFSIPWSGHTKTNKLVFTASLLDVQQLKGQREVCAVCGRQEVSLTRRPKGPFAVSWPNLEQLSEKIVITIVLEIYS